MLMHAAVPAQERVLHGTVSREPLPPKEVLARTRI